MTPIPHTVLEWSRGLASLSPGVVPCRGLRDEEWRETHRCCQEFVERWGRQAHAAGWDTLRLFGVGPQVIGGPVVEAERVRLSGVFAASLGADCAWDEAGRFAWIAAQSMDEKAPLGSCRRG